MPKKEGLTKPVVFFLLFIVMAGLSFWIIKPYVKALLAACVLAYVFHPVYRWVHKRTGRPLMSSILVSAFIIVILIIPVAFVIDEVSNEARVVYVRTKQILATGEILAGECEPPGSTACVLFNKVSGFMSDPEVQLYSKDAISKATTFVITKVTDTLLALPSILLNILIMFFATFYLLKDGPRLVRGIKDMLPVSKKHQTHIIKELDDVTYAVVYGSLIVALIQGLLGGLGFWAVGIQSPILWGGVMAVLALVPFLGTGLVWAPASIYLLLAGMTGGEPVLAYKGIGLLLYGLLIVGTIDNFIKPRLIGRRAGLHPVLVLVGVLGGMAVMGIVGFIIGPLILALLKSVVSIYEKEIRDR